MPAGQPNPRARKRGMSSRSWESGRLQHLEMRVLACGAHPPLSGYHGIALNQSSHSFVSCRAPSPRAGLNKALYDLPTVDNASLVAISRGVLARDSGSRRRWLALPVSSKPWAVIGEWQSATAAVPQIADGNIEDGLLPPSSCSPFPRLLARRVASGGPSGRIPCCICAAIGPRSGLEGRDDRRSAARCVLGRQNQGPMGCRDVFDVGSRARPHCSVGPLSCDASSRSYAEGRGRAVAFRRVSWGLAESGRTASFLPSNVVGVEQPTSNHVCHIGQKTLR